jgi:NADH:ubiquinone oxidoreductase subunit
MAILRDIFTWWHGSTIGTKLFTARNGEKVGEDEFGNVYYCNADDTRRWVIYDTESEASRISADWFGWLHHTFDEPPTIAPVRNWSWQKDRIYNKTGTDEAYRPPGSLVTLGGEKTTAKPAYTPWVPD